MVVFNGVRPMCISGCEMFLGLTRYWIVLCGLVLSVAVLADERTIRVVTSEYPPYEYLRDGQLVGTDTRLVRRVLSEMGDEASFQVLPWARAEHMVRAGTADMLYSLTFSETRNQYYHFTNPISTAQDVFFKHKSQPLQWQSFDDLEGLGLGLTAEYSYAPEFMDWLQEGKARITRLSQEQPELTGLRMVALGRIDLFICERSVCEYFLKQKESEFPELAEVEPVAGNVGPERGFRAGFSRKLPEGKLLRDEFNAALAKVRAR